MTTTDVFLFLICNIPLQPANAERTKVCKVSAASNPDDVIDVFCNSFHQKCCQTGCCPLTETYPWWLWTIIGVCTLVIIFCCCCLKICWSKRQKKLLNRQNDTVPLEDIKDQNAPQSYDYVYKSTST